MKGCKKCGQLKDLDEFYKAAGTQDGRRGDCKACNLAAKHERYIADPAKEIARVKAWQQENSDRVNAYQRARRQEPEVKRRARAGHLERKYGMTLDDYDRLLEQQGGGCAICGRPPRDDISLHVDHDHDTGRVRGLLCFPCNNTLGDFDDDPARLYAAADYLARDPELDDLIRRRVADLVGSRAN
ncbi:MAG: hypothetical protein QOE35_3808 [Actinomycetota bacterium]|jgi:hypothetical protein